LPLARIPRHQIDAIRDRVDIAEVIGRHVRLTRKGGSYVGLCPFHQEKTPSFNVVTAKGIYHCFGCNAGGDVFRFMMQIEGLSFIEAVKELAERAGIIIEEQEISPTEMQAIQRRKTLYDLLEATTAFFESVLWTRQEGVQARSYLADRDLTKDQITVARLGFAPSGWTSLLDHLHAEGFHPELIAEAGLARPRKQGNGHYDTFRDRLMIPIRDDRNRVIAFGGRLLEGEGPKYINSPETKLYQKSHTLYGFNAARTSIQKLDRVIVVEGYFDVLSMHQGGFTETIATCGTALTKEHLNKIRRMTRNVILLLDSDEAGKRAAERSLGMLLEAGLLPWRLELPDAKDPDELIREFGPQSMESALGQRQPLVEWVVQRKVEKAGSSAAGKEGLIEEMLPILSELSGDLISRVAARAGIPEPVLHKRLGQYQHQGPRMAESSPPPPTTSQWRPSRDIVHILWLLVHRYDQVGDLMSCADPAWFQGNEIIQQVLARLTTGEQVAGILQDATDPILRKTLSAIVAREHLYDPHESAAGICQIFERLRTPIRQARLAVLQGILEESIRLEDAEMQLNVLQERKKLLFYKKEIKTILLRGDVLRFRQLSAEESDLESI
jgi:DNA primase